MARTPSSAAAFELRVIDPSTSVPFSVAAVVRLVLVCDDTGQAGRHGQDAGRDGLHEIDRTA